MPESSAGVRFLKLQDHMHFNIHLFLFGFDRRGATSSSTIDKSSFASICSHFKGVSS